MEDQIKDLTLSEVLDVYEKYCFRHGLSPERHLTHLLLIICQIAEASLLLSKSKDSITDKVADIIQSICKFYQQLDVYTKEYTDKSIPTLLKKERVPLLYISMLADAFIHLLIYIGGNNWKEEFLEIIKSKYLNDSGSDVKDICRFMCNRIGWKLEQQIITVKENDDEDLYEF